MGEGGPGRAGALGSLMLPPTAVRPSSVRVQTRYLLYISRRRPIALQRSST